MTQPLTVQIRLQPHFLHPDQINDPAYLDIHSGGCIWSKIAHTATPAAAASRFYR